MNTHPRKPLVLLIGWIGLALTPTAVMYGQDTRGLDPEAVRMSPFEVSADQDVGYQGGDTTSGSRLNTSLKDTPAAIQVVTKEFMEDFGVTSLEEISAYSSNLRVDMRETDPAASPGFLQGIGRETRIVVRGLPASTAMDFFKATLPIDSYNTERFEIASGPNSILFGIANPGGLVNVMTKTAKVDRDSTGLRFKFGSWNLQRYELDHNQVVVPGKLAFRLNGLYEDADGWRTNMFRTVRRGAASMRFRPWDRTTIIVNGETGSIREHIANPFGTIEDNVQLWEVSGSPVMDVADWGAADRARGINRLAAVQNRYVTSADGLAPYFIPTRNAVGGRLLVSTFENFGVPGINRAGRAIVHPDKIPVENSLWGPDAKRFMDFDRLMISVDQELTENITLNLAYNNENGNQARSEKPRAHLVLQGDPNLTIPNPDGVGPAIPNPNAGELFIEYRGWFPLRGNSDQEVFRAAISGKFDLGRFGVHNVAGMYENSESRAWAIASQQIFVDDNNVPINNANVPENVANWVQRRHYVTPGDFSTYEVRDGLAPITITKNGVNYHTRLVNQGLGNRDIEESIETGLLVLQSSFFGERLVVTGGLRKDRLNVDNHAVGRYTAMDPEVVSGERLAGELRFTDEIADKVNLEPTTNTLGGVYHLNHWLSVFYNTSNNASAGSRNSIILPDKTLAPVRESETDDYGFMLNLLDGKLFLRATGYETAMTNNAVPIVFSRLIAPHTRILDALLANGRITDDEHQEHLLEGGILRGLNDEVNSGYEVSAWYNIKNFTAQFNFSYTKTDRTNIAPEFEVWLERERDFWGISTPGVGSLTDPASGTTIDDNAALLPAIVEDIRDLNNFGWGIRPYKANVSGRYSFSEGRLKGVFVGGGVRWQDSAPIHRVRLGFDELGNTIRGDVIEGAENFTMDGFVGYRTRIGIGRHNPNLTVQLNVKNLTDEGHWQPVRFNAGLTGLGHLQTITPRQTQLTVSLNF